MIYFIIFIIIFDLNTNIWTIFDVITKKFDLKTLKMTIFNLQIKI